MSDNPATSSSPKWGPNTKLVVGLTIVAIIVYMLVYIRSIIGPLLLALILAYALHPLAALFNKVTRLNWRWSVNVVFITFVILLLVSLTISGLAIVNQLQSLFVIVNTFTDNLPELVDQLTARSYSIGPFEFSLSQADLTPLVEQFLSTLQPLLGQVGTLVSTLATSAVTALGWSLFVLVIAYFLLARTGEVTDDLVKIDIPGYNTDIRRLGIEFRGIWNVFLRGQLVIFLLAIFLYSILLSGLDLRYALGIAILAGIARFIPYVGPFIVWVVTAMVSLFQSGNYFGLESWIYTILVVGLCLILDLILDNVVVPRFHGETLGLHPAAVLIAAIAAAQLIGLLGLVLAAPVLASIVLILRYTTRKMLDLDPFPESETAGSRSFQFPWVELFNRVKLRLQQLRSAQSK
jgi:predicted PurR-regulated permease PerM